MIKKYTCNKCNYATDRLSSYKLHTKTQKHIDINPNESKIIQNIPNESKNTICSFCNKSFSTYSNKLKHEKKCNKLQNEIKNKDKIKKYEKEIIKNNIEIAQKDQKIIMYEKIVEELKIQNEKIVEELKIQNNKLLEQNNNLTALIAHKPTVITNNTTSNTNNTINNVRSYAQKHYTDVEELKSINTSDYGKIMLNNKYSHDKDAINVLIKDRLIKEGEEAMILCKNDNIPFVKNLISFTRMNTLHKTLGDFIIDIYVKKDKSKQPIHLTDSSRMKFIYAHLQDSIDDKIIKWKNDPKGVTIVSIIIDPMLKYISHQVRIYQKNLAQDFIENSNNIGENKINDMMALQSLMNMCLKDNKRNKEYELRKKILDYIAPHFQFNKKLIAKQLLNN